jgi:hypothetical protein
MTLSTLWNTFGPRLLIDLLALLLLVRGVYHRVYQRSDLFLTFFALNLVVFLIALVLSGVEMTMGAAFGLFAVFSLVRYRTEGISARDMTYLFLVIALGLLVAIAPGGVSAAVVIAVLIVVMTAILEAGWLAPRELAQTITYDRVALVHSRARVELLADLRQRLGLDVQRVDVLSADFVRDCAEITIYHHGPIA